LATCPEVAREGFEPPTSRLLFKIHNF